MSPKWQRQRFFPRRPFIRQQRKDPPAEAVFNASEATGANARSECTDAAAPGTHHFLYVTCKRGVYNCEIQSINSSALCGPLLIYLFPFPLRNTSQNVTMKRLRNNSSGAINNNRLEHNADTSGFSPLPFPQEALCKAENNLPAH